MNGQYWFFIKRWKSNTIVDRKIGDIDLYFGGYVFGHAGDVVTSFELLCQQRLRVCHKYDLAAREPAIEVVHDDCRDERLAHPRGKTHERVMKKRRLHDA